MGDSVAPGDSATVASIVSAVPSAVNAIRHDRGGADDCSGARHRPADDTTSTHSFTS
jgi:hypothetical protein